MFRRLDRYVLSEILAPLGLGFLLYTFIMLLRALFRSAEMVIRRGVPFETVGHILLLSLPSIVVITIPMSLLFGILIAVGRLSSDSELVAIRASGVSLFNLYRPILLLSLLLAGLNVYLMVNVLPQGNHALQELRVRILTQSLAKQIEPRTFYGGWDSKMLYVFETRPNDTRWHGTFLADAIPANENEVHIAAYGTAAVGDEDIATLSLDQAFTHRVDFDLPDRYEIAAHSSLDLSVATRLQQRQRAPATGNRGLREMTLEQLRRRADDPNLDREQRNIAEVEIQKKFSIPFACLVFGLLGLPLGFNNARGGRSSGFALSILVFLAYYVLLNWGEELARGGDAPVLLAVWMPNALGLIIGTVLLARRNRDKSLMLTRLNHWLDEHVRGRWQARRDARRAAAKQTTAKARADALHAGAATSSDDADDARAATRAGTDLVLRLPSFGLGFPTLLDRYVISLFTRVLMTAFLMGIAVYLVADLTELIDDILENQVSWSVVGLFYQFKILVILHEIAPIIVLATTLVTFALLARNSEIVACKALGISLYRLSLPVILMAMLIVVVAGYLQREVLPAAHERLTTLENTIKGREGTGSRRADQRWIATSEGVLVNFRHYDPKRQALHMLQVFRFDPRHRLTDRLLVQRAHYAGDGWWTFMGGWARAFDGPLETSYATFERPVKHRLPIDLEQIAGRDRTAEEMRYGELRAHIEDLEQAGQQVPVLRVAMHNKLAYPAISLVMALVALPFAFRLGRRGALYGVGLSLILGILFMVLLALFTALGQAALLPPLVAVWAPSAIFAVFSLYLFLGVET
ncbi:MAG: LptF/LptG family permease [Acidobacteriota bacterium]